MDERIRQRSYLPTRTEVGDAVSRHQEGEPRDRRSDDDGNVVQERRQRLRQEQRPLEDEKSEPGGAVDALEG